MPQPAFGFTIPNRATLFGAATLDDLIELGVWAEATGVFKTLWVGDSIFAKPRPESIVLLSALAARTSRIRLAQGCFASFTARHPVLVAYQWATLDQLARGRTLLCVCLGGRLGGGDWRTENAVFGIKQSERVGRLEEGIEICRKLFDADAVSHEGRFYQFEQLSLQPRPFQERLPIWIAVNPRQRGDNPERTERALRRLAHLADGWMTTRGTPASFAELWGQLQGYLREEGRDPAAFDSNVYFNFNLNHDREAAAEESGRFLKDYYGVRWDTPELRDQLENWVAFGSADQVVERLQAWFEAGAREITLRATSMDQQGQMQRLVREVLPAFNLTAAR